MLNDLVREPVKVTKDKRTQLPKAQWRRRARDGQDRQRIESKYIKYKEIFGQRDNGVKDKGEKAKESEGIFEFSEPTKHARRHLNKKII